jgi:hypothetical protein
VGQPEPPRRRDAGGRAGRRRDRSRGDRRRHRQPHARRSPARR